MITSNNQLIEIMSAYNQFLQNTIESLKANGITMENCDQIRNQLPSAWADNLIADALDSISE